MRLYLLVMLCFCVAPQQPSTVATASPIEVMSQGKYSSWDRSQAGIIVAKNKAIYDKMCKFVNDKKDARQFPPYDDKFVYITAFAPETSYEPGWTLELHGVEQSKDDSLLIFIKATATDSKTSVKVSNRQPWIMFKLNIEQLKLTRHTRFQLMIRMIKTETIIPMEFR